MPRWTSPRSGSYGDVAVTVTATNHAGLTSTASSTLLVVPATGATTAPGTGTLSNTSGWEYGLHDGNYDVVMNLWHGTPGSIFRLYENGALVSTRVLGDTAGMSQTTGVTFEGKPNGTYVYTGELINAQGTTATTSTTVKVTDAAPGMPVRQHRPEEGRELVHRDREPVVGHERDVVPVRARRRRGRVGVARRGHAERAVGVGASSAAWHPVTTRSSRCSRTRTARRRRSRVKVTVK